MMHIYVKQYQIKLVSALGTHFVYIHHEHTEYIYLSLLLGRLPHKYELPEKGFLLRYEECNYAMST